MRNLTQEILDGECMDFTACDVADEIKRLYDSSDFEGIKYFKGAYFFKVVETLLNRSSILPGVEEMENHVRENIYYSAQLAQAKEDRPCEENRETCYLSKDLEEVRGPIVEFVLESLIFDP
jgi:hypothetical protein